MSADINMFLLQTVMRNDIPFALTTNVTQKKKTREEMFGALRGKYEMSDDFDAPLEDSMEYME